MADHLYLRSATLDSMAATTRYVVCVVTTLVIVISCLADAPTVLDPKDLWSLQPLSVVELPSVENSS